MRSRRATPRGASGSSNDASARPIAADPVSIDRVLIDLNRSARLDRSGIRAARVSTGLSRSARQDRNGIQVDPGSIALTRLARPDPSGIPRDRGSIDPSKKARRDPTGTRADGGSIGLNKSEGPDSSAIRADHNRSRSGARIVVNDARRVARNLIGGASVGSKRNRSRALRDPNRLSGPVPKSLVGSRARVKGRSRPGLRSAAARISPESAGGSCVITHVVLLRPRAGLSADERAGIVDAFRTAVRTIPSIRHVRLGKRVKPGTQYEQSMAVDYEYAALLDFDDVGGLQAYLKHPAHEALATRFFQVLDEALMYDFELDVGEAGLEKLA